MSDPANSAKMRILIVDDEPSVGDALKLVLRNFVLQHPYCEERHRRQLHAVERRHEDAIGASARAAATPKMA